MTNRNLRSYFPNYLSENSLFTKMSQLGAPWSQEVGQDMDDTYFTMYSGIKNPSEFVTLHLNPDSDVANSLTIARILYGMFGDNWARLWEASKTKYVPIDNYNMLETTVRTETDDRTIGRDVDRNDKVDENVTTDYGQKVDSTANAKSFTYGFNSEQQVPTGVQDETGTEANSGQDITATVSTSSGTSLENTTDNLNQQEDIQKTRKGNIGVTSTQELLKQEFDLWKWNFFKQVFEDVDTYLVLSVYSTCSH